jgi:hypothetical protein
MAPSPLASPALGLASPPPLASPLLAPPSLLLVTTRHGLLKQENKKPRVSGAQTADKVLAIGGDF